VRRAERDRLQREAERLRAEQERLASLVHRDAVSFDADDRVGAVQVDEAGNVVRRRVDPPQGSSVLGLVIDPLGASPRLGRDWRAGIMLSGREPVPSGPVVRPSTVDVPVGRGPADTVEDVQVWNEQRKLGLGWLGRLRAERGEQWGVPVGDELDVPVDVLLGIRPDA
jgi:hypothetical protein